MSQDNNHAITEGEAAPGTSARSPAEFTPGQRVVITQQIPHHFEVWTTRFTGTIERYEQRKTGSWFAHAKDHKLWLDRLIIRKDDGEIVICNLDDYTRIEPANEAAEAGNGSG